MGNATDTPREPRRRISIRALLIAAGIVVAIPLGYVSFLFLTYLDEDVTQGSEYGFTIGQSKEQAYRAAQSLFRQGQVSEIHSIGNLEDEIRMNPWLDRTLTLAEARPRFHQWDDWVLENPRKPQDEIIAVLQFQGDQLESIGLPPPNLVTSWRPANTTDLDFRQGQTRHEVLAQLEELTTRPGYEQMRLSTGWMARRQPVDFADSEYGLVEHDDRWTMLVGKRRSYFNSIRLEFRDGRLKTIHRHRQYFELP